MKQTISILAAILITLLLAAPALHAQIAIRDHVQTQIERNEELLRTAEELVRQTNSTKARTILKSGRSLHIESKNVFELAEDNYRKGHDVTARQMMNKAYELVGTAREALLRSITVAKREVRTEEAARKRLQHARDRFERARALLEESTGPERAAARKLLEESRVQLERSRNNLREHMYDVALRLADLSLSLSQKAMNTLKQGAGSKEMIMREIQKTNRLIEQIEDRGNYHEYPEANRIFTEARNQQERAVRNMNNQHYRAALELTQQARNRALRTLKILSSKTNRENVERALQFTGNLLEKARELIGNSNKHGAQEKLEEARVVQERARRNFAEGKLERSLQQTQRARRLVQECIDSMDAPLRADDIRTALQQTDILIDRLRAAENLAENTGARDLLAKSEQHQLKAWDAFNGSRLRAALTHTKLARNLANRALEQLHNERTR